jgi:hypothetical protein
MLPHFFGGLRAASREKFVILKKFSMSMNILYSSLFLFAEDVGKTKQVYLKNFKTLEEKPLSLFICCLCFPLLPVFSIFFSVRGAKYLRIIPEFFS